MSDSLQPLKTNPLTPRPPQEEAPEPEAPRSEAPKKKSLNKDIDLSRFQRVKLKEKIVFTKNLQVMLKTGLPLSSALKTLAEQSDNQKLQKILLDVQGKIEQGTTLAEAMSKYPKVFNELFINMIESGELSGNLVEVLDYLQLQMKKDHELLSKVRGAMIYPSIVLIAMGAIGTAMMVFVIPKLVSIFDEFKAELPLPTKILIAVSNFITSNGILVVIGVITLVALIRFAYRNPKGKRVFHLLFLKSPILGPITHKINLARFARTLSSLIKTDIQIVKSFEITSKTLGNVYYKDSLIVASENIKKGVAISESLGEYPKLYPPVVAQMVTVGEQSGEIDSVLMELAQFYEEDINQIMDNLPQVIEPLLILILGAGVGGMAVSIIMPLYTLTETI